MGTGTTSKEHEMTTKKFPTQRVLVAVAIAGAVGATSIWGLRQSGAEQITAGAAAQRSAYTNGDLRVEARRVLPNPTRDPVMQAVLAVFPNASLSDVTITTNRRQAAERAQIATAECYRSNFDLNGDQASDWARHEVDLTFADEDGESLLNSPPVDENRLVPLTPLDAAALAPVDEEPAPRLEDELSGGPERLDADEMVDFTPLREEVSGEDPTLEELQATVDEPEAPRDDLADDIVVDNLELAPEFENPCNKVPQTIAGELLFGDAANLQVEGAEVLSADELERLTEVLDQFCGNDSDDDCYTSELVESMYPIHVDAIERLAEQGYIDLG